MVDLNKILEGTGIKSESLFKIRFGQGVVGKTSYVAFGAITALAVIGLTLTNDWIRLIFGVGIVAIFFWHLHRTHIFAERNPDQSLMEGAELLAWKQAELAAKGLPKPPEEPLITNPIHSGKSLSQAEIENQE